MRRRRAALPQGSARRVSRMRALGPSSGNRTSEEFHYFLYITPDEPFVAGVAQQIRGMKGRHHLDAAHLVPVAAQLAYRSLHLQHRLHREGAQPDDDAWLDD